MAYFPSIAIGVPFFRSFDLIDPLAQAFYDRVIADGGTFEAYSCLTTTIQSLVNANLYDSASLIVTPNGVKSGKIYSLKGTDLTFSRASVANRTNSVGNIESMPTGVARIEYPVSGGCPAILLEPQRTNHITQSNNFLPMPGDWYDFNGSVPVANSATDPFGANNGWQLPSIAAFTRQYGLSISTAIGDVLTMSVFVKKNSTTTVRFRIQQSINGTYIASATYNLTTNTVTAGTGTIQDCGNGWYRLTVTGTTTVINSGCRPYFDGLNGTVYVFGFQAEVGAYASSYIATTTTSVTRIADACSIATSGVTEIIQTLDGVTTTITTIPSPYIMPFGKLSFLKFK
jgi:hypothetical protein